MNKVFIKNRADMFLSKAFFLPLQNYKLYIIHYTLYIIHYTLYIVDRLCSSMDRIKDSGSFDLGSNPSRVTFFRN